MHRDRREVQKLLRKAYEDRIDHQPQEVPEGSKKARAAAELDELLGECWRKYAAPEGEEDAYFTEEELQARESPEELEKERKDDEFYDKLASLFSKTSVSHPRALPDRKVPKARRGGATSVSVAVRTDDR